MEAGWTGPPFLVGQSEKLSPPEELVHDFEGVSRLVSCFLALDKVGDQPFFYDHNVFIMYMYFKSHMGILQILSNYL